MTGNRLDGSTAVIQHSRDSLLAITDSRQTTNPKGRT